MPVKETRIILAPYWTPGESPDEVGQSIDSIRAFANAVFVDARIFEWRTANAEGTDDGTDISRLETAWAGLEAKEFPYILGMNATTHGKRESLEWMEKKYHDMPVWDKNLSGTYADGKDGSEAYLCMGTRAVRGEIQMAFEKILEALHDKKAHDFLLAYAGAPQSMVARQGSKPGTLEGCDGKPSGFCVNPEQIVFWNQELAKRWDNNIVEFNREYQTTYTTFKDIPAPMDFNNPSTLSILYELDLIRMLESFENWQLNYLNQKDSSVPILNNGASFSSMLGLGVRNSYASFDAGSVFPFVPGGDISTVPGLLASGAALVMDGHRSFSTAAISACKLGLVDTWDASGPEYRLWLAQMAARFKQVYAVPFGWNESGSSKPRPQLADAFTWATQLGTIDIGQPLMPTVAIMTPYSSWSTDDEKPWVAEKTAYQQLYVASVDRVLVSEFQVERGWLESNKCQILILPHVRTLSTKAITAIQKWSQTPGKRLFVIGPFAEKDSTLNPGPGFIQMRDDILASAGTRKVEDINMLSRMVRPALDNTGPVTAGIEMTRTSEGYCLVQAGPFVNAKRVNEHPPLNKYDVTIDGYTVRGIPVQYFTFLHRVAHDWIATAIDAQGTITHTKVNGTT